MLKSTFVVAVALIVSCASTDRDRAWVAEALRSRHVTSAAIGTPHPPQALQQMVRDGLSASEAVTIALANNPTYQADLARIDSARADLDEANTPVNPQLSLLAAIGPISAMATLLAPLESMWQIPHRSAMAARTVESIAESLVQSGLDLARDAKVAHANRALAEDRLRIRGELVAVATELEQLAEQRVTLGEAAPAEVLSLKTEVTLAEDQVEVGKTEVDLTRAQLRSVLGIETHEVGGFAISPAPLLETLPSLRELSATARHSRPDVHAAELAVLAAGERAGWERSKVMAVAAQFEGHWTRPDTYASRMGLCFELPIFGSNPGGRGRAQAELQRSAAALRSLRQRVSLELLQAHTAATQARASLVRFRESVLPALDAARTDAAQSYKLGEETYVAVLDLLRRGGEARLRETELVAQARRADAELERATGARIGAE
jgi:cobalt-zinc-cadmium efflux system outer membrane protein